MLQAVLSQPQEWVAILTHSLREGEATGAEAAAAARGAAAAHAQELEAAAASGNEEMEAELALHRSRCQQQASEAEALQQRLVQDRNVTARQATWDDPHAWRTRPGEQREQEAALAACKRDWEAQLAEQARELWRKGGEVIAGWVQPSARGDLRPRDIPPPELQKKLQAHLHLLAETQLRANEAGRQAERLVSEERATEEATAAHREASEAGNVALGKLALQLQTDGATLLRQQQAGASRPSHAHVHPTPHAHPHAHPHSRRPPPPHARFLSRRCFSSGPRATRLCIGTPNTGTCTRLPIYRNPLYSLCFQHILASDPIASPLPNHEKTNSGIRTAIW